VLTENCKKYSIQSIIIAGPGFSKEHLISYLKQKVSEIKTPIILENASSANKSGVYEVVKRGATSKVLGQLRISQESELMDEVLRRLGKNQKDVSYGFSEIKKVASNNAIETLLLTDISLREQPIEIRKEIDRLIRDVEKTRGKLFIISTLHPAGEQLSSLGGIAGLLRFEVY
jgi:protein pelota